MVARIEAHFNAHDFGLFAVEERDAGGFIGYVGLWPTDFDAAFTPAVEVGWRLAAERLGAGLRHRGGPGCGGSTGSTRLGLDEIVSFTALLNERSWRVMERLGMRHDPADDFDHPKLRAGHRLERHVLYRMRHPGA